MKFWPRLLALGLGLLAPAALLAQVPPERALSTLTAPDGLELTLWASEPAFVNPTCIDVDHKGRVWVCESVNYRSKLRHQPFKRPEGDRIVILEDSKGTGRADKVTTFYQSPDLLAPLGIAVAPDPAGPGCKVYVCQSPDILVFEDKDGDGKADGPPRKLLSGFGGYDHDHGVHGILIGPDGKLYFSVGDTGVHGLQSSDGKGRKWQSNATDCRAGTVWRCDLDGKNVQQIAHNFRNEYEPCVDSFGTVFVSDNDDDGNQQTRICYAMPGGNYGYHPRGPGQTHWHEEQPGVVPKILRTYFGSPTGLCVYEGSLLPPKYRGQLLHTDAGPRHLRCYHLTPAGAGYQVEREDMVTSKDNWFRPSDVCVAPDGSVFVADWYDPGVGGHGMGDISRGRIYRLAPRGHRPRVPAVDLRSEEGIRTALGSPNRAVRSLAMAKLRGLNGEEAHKVLRPALQQRDNPFLRARAFWQLYSCPDVPTGEAVRAAIEALKDRSDPRFAVLALRLLRDRGVRPADLPSEGRSALLAQTAAVRREALLALRDTDPARAKPLLIELAKQYDGKDRFYLAAIGIAVGQHDPARRDALLADFGKEFPGWNDVVADLVWELRPASVLPQLGQRLADTRLSAAQRGRIVDILATADDKTAGLALLKVLQGDVPAEVRDKVFANLKLYLPGKWNALRRSPELDQAVAGLLARPESRAAGLALLGAADRTDRIPDVLKLARGKDEAGPVRVAAVQALGDLPSDAAVQALHGLTQDAPAALRIEAVQALGKLARQKPKQPGTAAALKALQNVVRAPKGDPALAQAALSALAGTRPGTMWLLELNTRKELPEAFKDATARLLRNSPYPDLRNRALIAFPPPGRLHPKKLPPLATLVARKGNAGRGRQLLAASLKGDLACLRCHSVRGSGGAIGPDLSLIGKKASKENLFESILYPSKAVADQYVNWQIETKKGVALSGLLIEETADHVTLRDANGKDTRIDKKDVEGREKNPKSLMPEDLLVYLTEDDLVDLVAYLQTLQTPTLTLDYWHILGPFDNGTGDAGMDRTFPPEKEIRPDAAYPGKSGPVRWRTVRPDAQGYVDLQAFFAGGSDNIVSYLYRDIESPADQEATVLLGADDCCKVWVNDKLAHDSREHRSATPEQYTFKVKLRKGRNRVVIKINNGAGPHGLYFTLLAEQEVKRLDR